MRTSKDLFLGELSNSFGCMGHRISYLKLAGTRKDHQVQFPASLCTT